MAIISSNGAHVPSVNGVLWWALFNSPSFSQMTNLDDFPWYYYPSDDAFRAIDITNIHLGRLTDNKEKMCSGSFGGTPTDVVGYKSIISFECVWEWTRPPDVLMQKLDGVAAYIDIGDPFYYQNWEFSSPSVATYGGSPNEPFPRSYWIPVMQIDSAEMIEDANAHKFARMRVMGHALTKDFLIPDEGTLDNVNSKAGAFYQALINGYVKL